MKPLFFSLLDDAIGEVLRREPTYFSRFELAALDPALQTQAYHTHPLFEDYSKAKISECLEIGKAYFIRNGLKYSKDIGKRDAVSAMLFDSVMDAFAAEQGRLLIRPEPFNDSRFVQRFKASYDQHMASNGLRYFISRQGHRPLLLITAVGVPIAAWSKLLLDGSHEFRIIVVETRYSDIYSGGLRGNTHLRTDAEDIAAVLEGEQIDSVDVIAWSNGARVAIELAFSWATLVRSLILLGPTLCGIEGITPIYSEFEEQITRIFAAVGKNPVAANFFSRALTESIRVRNWDSCGADPDRRARMLLSLPAREHAPMLIAPLANGDLLFNFMERFAADLRHQIRDRLSSLKLPLLVVTGDHDHIVSNSFTHAVLSRFVPHFIHVNVKGAGHCTQDLQYRYFRSLIKCFTNGDWPAISTARIEVIPGDLLSTAH